MAKRLFLLVVLIVAVPAWAQQAPIEYKLSFPAPEHRWMQVEVRFPNVPAGTLQLRMARTSPGRYALHEFAKNVFDVSIVNGRGQALAAARPDPHQWDVANHDGTVVVTYKIFGDSPEPPAHATVYFRGDDPRMGRLTKYTIVRQDDDAREHHRYPG